MQGREFLELAREMLAGATEKHWRGAVGRAYYALMLECKTALERWGFPMPARENAHQFVRTRFRFPINADLEKIADVIEPLGQLRNRADYDLSPLPALTSGARAQLGVRQATTALALLDALDGDPVRRAVVFAAIQAAFP